MNQDFDIFGQVERPSIILCNPNKQELYSLALAYETKFVKRFNSISEFSFNFPQSIDGGQTEIEAYDYLRNKRLVLIENEGYFQIDHVEEDLTGAVPIKHVSCKSLESELIQRRLVSFGGTKPLYNPLSPSGTILQEMVNLCPTWTIGNVDVSLLGVYRTFDVSDSNVYEFLMGDCAKAFECVFEFNTVSKTISATAIANATIVTDIFLSFDNLISQASFSEHSDEIVTCLSVKGGGNLSIAPVNPLGGNKLYDFSYYATSEWMSESLVSAINAWDALVDSKQSEYSSLLTQLQTYNAELLTLQSALADLNAEYLTLEGVQKVRIEQGLSYSDITVQMVSKQNEINSQNTLIINKQTQIASTTALLQAINTEVSFENNFTPSQLLELDSFIFENSYLNNNVIMTDSMTLVEIQQAEQQLYDQAQNVLAKVSQPRYEFSLESINYLALQEFKDTFTAQTELGGIFTAELEIGQYIEAVLLELEYSFDDPTNFKMTFSNRLRLDNAGYVFSDLLGEVKKVGDSVAFDSYKWANWSTDYKDTVSEFITSSLNAANNAIINSDNQEILINQNGLRGRTYNPNTQSYEQTQVWLTSSVLAFSDDGFQTSKLALGKVNVGGQEHFGLVGDVIVGRILAGNSLAIANEGNNFTLDSSGATLNNAKFTVATTNTRIFIDPTSTISFRIQKNEGGTFADKFWVDNTGNVNFSGNLTGATGVFTGTLSASVGNIGMLVINGLGLSTPDGQNYLRGDGSLKWGGLSISGSSATFNGTIFANKISGTISYNQLTDIPADKISSGTMSGARVYGGTATLSGITSIGSFLSINGGIDASGACEFGSVSVHGGITAANNVQIGGRYWSGGRQGLTGTYAIGIRQLTFSGGILTGFS